MERFPSHGAMLITAPSEHERVYEMAVRINRSEFVVSPKFSRQPWIKVRACDLTGEIYLTAGVKVKRKEP